MDADGLRQTFLRFFEERGHAVVPSASLIPHDPTVLLTIAGMVPFKPYFLGDEAPAYPRATSIQKCFRTADIEVVGGTVTHLTFFEMLGNFSFGDYFKDRAIPFAWELLTGPLGLDPDRLWITVHHSDDDAALIWQDAAGVRPERIQRMGEDNFWKMGETGPCGPSSEVYFDLDGGPGGGPAGGDEDRYVEIWNLVFMQYNRGSDGSLEDLPRPSIDTGAGFERILPIVQGAASVFETDLMAPVVAAAESLTGRRYGGDSDTGLRVLADHARAMTFLTADGVLPSNEGRGYVLRRIVRRALRTAFQMGVESDITEGLVAAVVEAMSGAYPDLVDSQDFVAGVVAREEDRFRQTLRSGSAILEEELARSDGTLSGEVVFRLHDTFGFPVDLTREIAAERGTGVDLEGFEAAMSAQRERAREAGRGARTDETAVVTYRELLEEFGPTEFTGYEETSSKGRVLAVRSRDDDSQTGPGRAVEVYLDRSPFYAEGGGQVGDTGTISTSAAVARVVDTDSALPGLIRHHAVLEGDMRPGDDATASIDVPRREAIRRNHTGTHLLHWALRQVLGGHVRQQGSLVAPDRLRFDFSHSGPVGPEALEKVEDLANERILADEPVRAYETTRRHAEEIGAVAFFGEKYGEVVRVVEAGGSSVELCGGTHVSALGMIGPLKVVSETSIGSNTRRIEALTGQASLARIREADHAISSASELLRSAPGELVDAVGRLLERQRAGEEELRSLRRRLVRVEASELVAGAVDGVVVARRDKMGTDELRELAAAVRDEGSVDAVVLVGSPDGKRAALVAAVAKGSSRVASELISDAARIVGGGGGRDPVLAVAGGRDATRIDEALTAVREKLS